LTRIQLNYPAARKPYFEEIHDAYFKSAKAYSLHCCGYVSCAGRVRC
jgi:hypothetical protein